MFPVTSIASNVVSSPTTIASNMIIVVPVLVQISHLFIGIPTSEMFINATLIHKGETTEVCLHSRRQRSAIRHLAGNGGGPSIQRAGHRGVGEFGIEVRGISFAGQLRLERRDNVLLVQFGPIDVGKEGVFAQFLSIVGCTQSVLRVSVKKLEELAGLTSNGSTATTYTLDKVASL
jgi:hypothetical protein